MREILLDSKINDLNREIETESFIIKNIEEELGKDNLSETAELRLKIDLTHRINLVECYEQTIRKLATYYERV